MSSEIIEPCPGCGRRSSQMWGKYCRYCYSITPDPEEKAAFLALCERQKVKMTNLEIYFRRRKNALRLAALAWNKKTAKNMVKSGYERPKLIERSNKLLEHFCLIDEVWNCLNPTRRFASDWGKGFEVLWAADAIIKGNFDAKYDAEIEKRDF